MQDKLHEHHQNEADIFDEWVKKFFLNPETSLLDHQLFTIDIYESEEEYMVEAVLENRDVKDIKVCLSKNELSIHVDSSAGLIHKSEKGHRTMKRTIPFPFIICTRKVTAEFFSPLLIVRIHKLSPGMHSRG